MSGTLYVQRDREIVAIDLATFAERPLGIRADAFRVSPDGTQVAYVLSGTLAIAAVDGRDQRVLAEGANDDFSWAPDSAAIAFVKAPESTRWTCPSEAEIWVVELPGGEMRRIDAGCNPAWSPDGLRIAYVSSYDFLAQSRGDEPPNALYLVNRYGEHRWNPAQGGEGFGLENGDDWYRRYFYHPFWSADGAYVFVPTYVFPEWCLAEVDTLEMVDSYKGTAQTIGVVYDLERDPILSPSGDQIAYGCDCCAGFGILCIATLLGDEHGCKWYEWCSDIDLKLRMRSESHVYYVWGAAWAPGGDLLAAVYCPGEITSHCYRETAIAEVRLVEAQSGTVSAPLVKGIDPYGGIEWRP